VNGTKKAQRLRVRARVPWLTRESQPSILSSRMWGYAEGNKTVVAVVVALVAIAAVAFFARKLWRRGR
jgi:cytochrome c-type biogenesis protein CcmH/NrfG